MAQCLCETLRFCRAIPKRTCDRRLYRDVPLQLLMMMAMIMLMLLAVMLPLLAHWVVVQLTRLHRPASARPITSSSSSSSSSIVHAHRHLHPHPVAPPLLLPAAPYNPLRLLVALLLVLSPTMKTGSWLQNNQRGAPNLLSRCTSRVIRLEAPGSVGVHSPPPHRQVFVKISDQVPLDSRCFVFLF